MYSRERVTREKEEREMVVMIDLVVVAVGWFEDGDVGCR